MAVLATGAAAASDAAGLAEARGLPTGSVTTASVEGVGDCPVILSVDSNMTGGSATRGAAKLDGGWVLGGQDGALAKVLDVCAGADANPSQFAAIVSAMAFETPLTPILVNGDAFIRDRLADVNRGYLPPETRQDGAAVRLTFQALVGDTARPGEVEVHWTPGGAATVSVEPY